ncbi:hypothetical protein Tco_0811188 [Tanacetum coccineum]
MVSLSDGAGRTFVAAGTIDGVVANGFRSGNTTIAARCDYVMRLGLKRQLHLLEVVVQWSPSELPKKNYSSNTSTKLARAKLDKCSRDVGMSKDMLENINVLRTMIKELDHQAKEKATPRKLVYVDSEKEALDRLKNQSQAKERARSKKSKLRERRSEYQERSTDSEYDEGSSEMVCPFQGDKGNTRLVWSGGQERARNINEPREIEEVVASNKIAHLVRDIRRSNQKSRNQRRNDVKVINMISRGRNRKRPYEEERSGLTEELTFPTIP